MKKWKILIWFLCAFCGSAFSSCPSTWQLKENSCFKVVNLKKTWREASTDCHSQLSGAHLIYLNNRSILFADSLANVQAKEYFVGAKKHNDSWLWGNGKQVVKNFCETPNSDEVYVALKQKDSVLVTKKASFEAFYICESCNMTCTAIKTTPFTPSLSYGPTKDEANQSYANNFLIRSFIRNITRLDFKKADSLNMSIDMIQRLLMTIEINEEEREFEVQDLMLASEKLEEFAMKYATYHVNGASEVKITRGYNAVFRAKKVFPTNDNYTFQVADAQSQDAFIVLPKENFDENGSLVVSMSFKHLDNMMTRKQHKIRSNSNRFQLQSRILSTTFGLVPKVLKRNVTLRFSLSKSPPGVEDGKLCVFWKFPSTYVEKKDTGWSRVGCTMVKSTDRYVECSCNHLTHFAVLVQVKDEQVPSDHDMVLTILTNIGLGLSIVGCFLTFLAYWRLTDVRSEQSQIRMNLVFALAVAHILFLLGSAVKSNIFLCISVAALMQLFYTSALCWMFAEGIQLYMQVIKVFNTNLKMRQVYGFAWGLPIILIIVSLSIAGNGPGGLPSFVSEGFCWLSTKNHLIWTFVISVLLLIMSNHVILVMVVKELSKIKKQQDITSEHHTVVRSSIRALFILAPLLGITWVVGLLCIVGAGIAGLYIFTILNSFQGIFIFILHCMRNSEIQGKLRRRIEALDGRFLKHSSLDPNHSNQSDIKQSNRASKEGITLEPVPMENLTLSDFDHLDFQRQ